MPNLCNNAKGLAWWLSDLTTPHHMAIVRNLPTDELHTRSMVPHAMVTSQMSFINSTQSPSILLVNCWPSLSSPSRYVTRSKYALILNVSQRTRSCSTRAIFDRTCDELSTLFGLNAIQTPGLRATYSVVAANITAVHDSRNLNIRTEWSKSLALSKNNQTARPFDINLFASHSNETVMFVSWVLDPDFCFIDALPLNWSLFCFNQHFISSWVQQINCTRSLEPSPLLF